jgi:hypothetical protein
MRDLHLWIRIDTHKKLTILTSVDSSKPRNCRGQGPTFQYALLVLLSVIARTRADGEVARFASVSSRPASATLGTELYRARNPKTAIGKFWHDAIDCQSTQEEKLTLRLKSDIVSHVHFIRTDDMTLGRLKESVTMDSEEQALHLLTLVMKAWEQIKENAYYDIIRPKRLADHARERLRAEISLDLGDRLRQEAQKLLADCGRASLSFVDDAIAIGDVSGAGLRMSVVLEQPYIESEDEIADAFTPEIFASRRPRWLDGYCDVAHSKIRASLTTFEDKQPGHACKIGVARFDSSLAVARPELPALAIRPLNHLLTDVFNRKLADARLRDDSDAENVWQECMRRSLQPAHGPQQVIAFACPSQLFLEVAIVSIDLRVPILVKDARNSVYALRAVPDRVRTCGLEFGPNWSRVVHQSSSGTILDWEDVLLEALAKELCIRGAKTYRNGATVIATRPGQTLLDCGERAPQVGLFELVLQTIHLNSAILGYCVLPFNEKELREHWKQLPGQAAGGLAFDQLEFIPLNEVQAKSFAERTSSRWHGTALMRLELLQRHMHQVERACEALRAKGQASRTTR